MNHNDLLIDDPLSPYVVVIWTHTIDIDGEYLECNALFCDSFKLNMITDIIGLINTSENMEILRSQITELINNSKINFDIDANDIYNMSILEILKVLSNGSIQLFKMTGSNMGNYEEHMTKLNKIIRDFYLKNGKETRTDWVVISEI